MIQFIHAADLHLDSAFAALPPRQAAARRRESRENLQRLTDYVNDRGIQLVLLAGDLLDSSRPFRETGEVLAAALGRMQARVFIAPGNHDFCSRDSLWETVHWPENVYVFREDRLQMAEVPEWNAVIHGAAFTGPEQHDSFLHGFTAPADGRIHIGLLHGEIAPAAERYDPLGSGEIAASGLHYLALGHIHKRMEPQYFGKTLCAWPGCLEGRGFDETGEKGFYQGTIDENGVRLTFVPFARRKYETVTVDVTDRQPLEAILAALPETTGNDLYRIVLTGETGDGGADPETLRERLAERFYALEIQDRTRMAEDIWARSGEDSLRGLFLRELRAKWDAAATEAERQTVTRAARFGLAALDHRDLG